MSLPVAPTEREATAPFSSASSSAPLLEMQGVGKRFGGVVALDNVSLSVGRGEILALIGENGAGKSTLMKVLGGLYIPDAGTVRVDGKDARLRSVGDAADLGIGFIHQELNLLENLDVAANVFLGREPTRGGPLRLVDQAALQKGTKKWLEMLALDIAPDAPVARLSLAQRQMVEIARALSQEARLLIMDEPTSSLTLGETHRLLGLITRLREEQGVSIIYISHRLGEIRQIADRVVALRDGKNAGTLSKAEITQEAMVRLMVGRDIAPSVRQGERQGAGSGPPRLEARNLQTARYPARAVSFTLEAGEILGFAGLVGAGRTEVVEALFGVHPAVGGQVLLNGTPLRLGTARDAIRHGIYLIPEDRRRCGLIPSMAIRENITLPSLMRYATSTGWIRAAEERSVAEAGSQRLNVRSAAGTVEAAASTLSGGNQQKVVLAKWLPRDPQVLLFDEPTRGVDVGAKAEIYLLIRSLAEAGAAVIVVSSDMEEVLALSDRVAVMHEGALTGILPREQSTEEAIMRLAVGDVSGGKTTA